MNKIYTVHDLMEVIVVILNTRDPYTFEHSWRVSALCESIVAKMDIDNKWVETIHIAAHLHDVGKIGVPDIVLNKPAKLTDDEFKKIKTHPEVGYNIVNKLPQLEEIALYVRHHHERWDGRGYPLGLAGRDIPFGARVIAVADTFDAITSDRPYRKGFDYDFAFNEIKKAAGTQLCPEIVEVFLSIKDDVPGILSDVNREIEARNLI